MSLTASEIAVVVDRLAPRLKGAQIQRIAQPSPERFLIECWAPVFGKTVVFIELARGSVRFHATAIKFKNPDEPPALCLQLRRLFESGRIRSLEAVPGDRIVRIAIDVMEDGAVHARKIVLELFATHPALFALDEHHRIVAASDAVHTSDRQMAKGERYESPPSRPRRDDEERPFARFGADAPEDLFARLDAEIPDEGSSIDRAALVKDIEKEVQRQRKRLAKIEEDARRNEGADDLERLGELLKASLGEVVRGADRVRVPDFYAEGDATVEVPLDPTLTPAENAAAYFERAKKKRRGLEAIRERLIAVQAELRELCAFADRAKDGAAEELNEIAAEARRRGLAVEAKKPDPAPKKREKVAPRRPYHVFTSTDGIEIRVGRSSADNDELTFRHADGDDWWLHAQNVPGSHIVVRCTGAIPEQTLVDAATLAVAYSKAPFAGKQDVSYTRKKHVSKFRGAPPGKVILKEWKTFTLRCEPERLERLKAGRSADT